MVINREVFENDRLKRFTFIFMLLFLVSAASASENASVMLHGEKTSVFTGEDIVLRLSAVNIITEPVMTVQVILIPPSGMSVTSSDFVMSAAGQFTSTFKLEPGTGKDLEVRIKTNQEGDFNVTGRVIYFFGDDKTTKEDHSLSLPIMVRAPHAPTGTPTAEVSQTVVPPKSQTNIWIFAWIIVLILIVLGIHRYFDRKGKADIKEVNEMRNIILYFIALAAIAYGLTGLFADTRDLGYIAQIKDISPHYKESWFSLLTFCFGAFYGIAVIVTWFDRKKRFHGFLILSSSLIVVYKYFHVITLRPVFFILGFAASAFISHIFRYKEEENVKYQVSTFTITALSIGSVWLAFINYVFGSYDVDLLIWYFFLAIAFSAVFYKFSLYEISNLKLFIVGPRSAGKTVFVSMLYEEALRQKRIIGSVSENLVEPVGDLRKGMWPPANSSIKPYYFRYVHGNLFTKEVNIDIDYSGELFENQIAKITRYLENKRSNNSILPKGDIENIADGIYNANKLLFIIDPERAGSAEDTGNYIKDQYMPIIREVSCPYYLLITKSDMLYGGKSIDRSYETFKKYVMHEIEIKEHFYKDIKSRARAVLPVYISVNDGVPVAGMDGISGFGYDKVLYEIGK